jgi:hypothetical protein
MVRLLTTGEYLPPLPQELPTQAFCRIGASIALTSKLRARVSDAAYQLVDGMHRRAYQPSAGDVEKRLKRLIKLLNKPAALQPSQFCDELSELLDSDDIGDALGSLLTPPCPREPPMRTLSPDALERRRTALRVAATELQGRVRSAYGGMRGREPRSYFDVFILRLAEIFEEGGGKATAYYDVEQENRNTPFVLFVAAVAGEAFRCFAPEVFAPDPCEQRERQKVRESLTLGALGERVRVALNTSARLQRAVRADAYNRKQRAGTFTPLPPG